MAHLLKQMTTVYIDTNGNRVSSSTPGAVKRTIESAKWYVQGVPGWPKTKRKALSKDKRVATKMMNDLVEKAERGMNGMAAMDLARADLGGLIAEFEVDLGTGLANRGRSSRKRPSEKQVALVGQRLRTLVAGCKFVTVGDLNDAATRKVGRYLGERAALARKDGGLSAQSCECYRKAIARFVWWLSQRKSAPVRADLLSDLPAYDFKRGRVHQRRVLPDAELATLFDATRDSGAEVLGLSGEARYYLYLVAAGTGFRASELASLTPSSFELSGSTPTVALEAKYAKNGTAATNPIGPGLARKLVGYLAGRPTDVPVWPGTWAKHTQAAKMLRRDLKRAGIPYVVNSPEGPKYFDFHALRHTYLSRLVGTGASPKEFQTLGRHSDAATSLSYYAHTDPEALAAAVGRLPSPGGEEQEGDAISRLPREELELMVRVLAAKVFAVEALTVSLGLNAPNPFTPLFTPDVDSGRDEVERTETREPVKSARRTVRRRLETT